MKNNKKKNGYEFSRYYKENLDWTKASWRSGTKKWNTSVFDRYITKSIKAYGAEVRNDGRVNRKIALKQIEINSSEELIEDVEVVVLDTCSKRIKWHWFD